MSVDFIYQHALAATVHRSAPDGVRSLMVTSAEPGEGKSSVCAELARGLARSGRESIGLVDADQFNPTQHRIFDLPDRRGLSDLLEEACRFDLTREAPVRLGIGDWVEIVGGQSKTGELSIDDGERRFMVHFVRGAIRSVSGPASGDDARLGQMLVGRGRITDAQREDALRVQQENGRPLGEILRTLGYVTEPDLADAMRAQSSRRILLLAGLGQATCRFRELAEPYRSAFGGRPSADAEGDGIELHPSGRVHEYLGDPFLSSRVRGYLSDTTLPGLEVLAAGTRPCDLQAPGLSVPFGLMIRRLERMFDRVLIDAPPVSMASPTATLAGQVDGILLVVKADGAGIPSIRRAVGELRRAGGHVLGAVLNQVEASYGTRSHYYESVIGGGG
jgi:Mrp family chromosome partitioning ATPase